MKLWVVTGKVFHYLNELLSRAILIENFIQKKEKNCDSQEGGSHIVSITNMEELDDNISNDATINKYTSNKSYLYTSFRTSSWNNIDLLEYKIEYAFDITKVDYSFN